MITGMHSVDSLKFKTVFDSTPLNDGLYFFLQLIHRLYPEDAFHYIIAVALKEKKTDEEIYKEVQRNLPGIKPFWQKLTYIKPFERRLKKELVRQTVEVLGNRKLIENYLQIGSSHSYAGSIKKQVKIKGNNYFINVPDYSTSITEIIEQGKNIPTESLGLVACYTGLHHYAEEYINDLIKFIKRVLRKGGVLVLREYDVKTTDMQTFMAVIHSVMNITATLSWQENVKQYQTYRPAEEWSNIITSYGFEDTGFRLLQDKDPSLNTLMGFVKL